jgi:hypothetical protein
MWTPVFLQILQSGDVIAVASLYSGVLARATAIVASKRGPSVLQPYRDLAKWLRKSRAISDQTSWAFRGPPFVALACYLTVINRLAIRRVSGDADPIRQCQLVPALRSPHRPHGLPARRPWRPMMITRSAPTISVGSAAGIVCAAGGLSSYFPPLVMGARFGRQRPHARAAANWRPAPPIVHPGLAGPRGLLDGRGRPAKGRRAFLIAVPSAGGANAA